MRHERGIARGGDRVLMFGFYLAEAALGLIVALIVIDVCVRNFLGIGLTFTTEYCGYLLAWIVFLGAPYSLRHGEFLRIEMIGPRMLRALEGLYALCAILISSIFLYALVQLVFNSHARKILAPTLTDTPLWMPQVVLPVGMALMVLSIGLGFAGKPASDASEVAGEDIKEPI